MKKGFLYGFVGAIVKIVFPYKIVYKGEIPREGGAVVTANHLSYVDFFFVRDAMKRHTAFMAKKEICRFKIMDYFVKKNDIIPVDRHSHDLTAIKRALKALKDGKALGIFPEGTRKFKNKTDEFHNGAAMVAIRTGSPVVPVRIFTKNDRVRPFRLSTVVIGEPFLLEATKNYDAATEIIKEKIYSLEK